MSNKNELEKDSEKLNKIIPIARQSGEYRVLVEKLKPLIKSIVDSSNKKETFSNFLKLFSNRFKKSGQRMRFFKEDSKAESGSQLDTLRKAFVFLALFETTVGNLLDIIIIILILNDHDFFIQWTKRYARNYDDLDDSHLAEKLNFLKVHDLNIFSEYINKNLRNKIAHMDFDINENNIICIGQQRVNLDDAIFKLECISMLVAIALRDSGLRDLLII